MQKRNIVQALILISVLIVASVLIFTLRKTKSRDVVLPMKEVAATSEKSVNYYEKKLLLDTDDGVKKIDIASGKFENASPLEQNDFSDFSGLPKEGNDSKVDTEQAGVIYAPDSSQAIVTQNMYEGSTSVNKDEEIKSIVGNSDFLCNINKKECQKTELLSQIYQGLDNSLQKNATSFVWVAWSPKKNLLFGHMTSSEVGETTPVYVCNTIEKKCSQIESGDTQKAVVPAGAYSPSLEKIAVIAQHDKPNEETGKNWELLIFSPEDTEKPLKIYDLSVIIDRDENVAYDGVHSLAWSGDEKKIAIGTSRRIFMMDLESGGLSLAYIAPTDAEGDFYWDSSALFLSPDAKFIAFVDETDQVMVPENSDNIESNDQVDETPINSLKKIDLENSNSVSEILRGTGLSIKL